MAMPWGWKKSALPGRICLRAWQKDGQGVRFPPLPVCPHALMPRPAGLVPSAGCDCSCDANRRGQKGPYPKNGIMVSVSAL